MKRFICFLMIMALGVTGCVTNPETGKREFAPIESIQSAVSYVKEIPDETKASILEVLALVLGATGVGGGITVLAQKGASYYRNKGSKDASKTEDK